MTEHPFGPVFDAFSRILILGSFPSPRSRAEGFYYGHPQNRFWHVLALVFSAPEPRAVEEKKEFLLSRGIALWDAAARCETVGAADTSIKNAQPNDVGSLIASSRVTRVYANGGMAARLYERLVRPSTNLPAVALPSTSPANAAWTPERLADAWRVII